MKNWKSKYPFTLDEHLIKALTITMKVGDKYMAKKLLGLLVHYRKAQNYEKALQWLREKQ